MRQLIHCSLTLIKYNLQRAATKAAGDEPLPYKFRIKFFVFYTAKPKFKRSG